MTAKPTPKPPSRVAAEKPISKSRARQLAKQLADDAMSICNHDADAEREPEAAFELAQLEKKFTETIAAAYAPQREAVRALLKSLDKLWPHVWESKFNTGPEQDVETEYEQAIVDLRADSERLRKLMEGE